jgi:hypothetical protein
MEEREKTAQTGSDVRRTEDSPDSILDVGYTLVIHLDHLTFRGIRGQDGSTPEANARIVRLSYDIEPLRGGEEGCGRVGCAMLRSTYSGRATG